jgi:hypothetical protein
VIEGAAEGNLNAVALPQQLAGGALKVSVAYLVCRAGNRQQRRGVSEGRGRWCGGGHVSASNKDEVVPSPRRRLLTTFRVYGTKLR